MLAMLQLQFMIFALIGIGFFVRRRGMVGREGQKNITDLVINVILPCNIVTSFTTSLPDGILHECLVIFLISVGIQIFCLIYGRIAYPRESEARRKCLAYGIICSNAGFLGNPIALGMYGAEGLALASVYLIPVRTMMWSAGIAIFSGQTDIKGTLKKVVTHPCVQACVIGIIIMVTGFVIPAPIQAVLTSLGNCNTAMSMMVIGMILAQIDLSDLWDKTVVRYTLERLILIPALIGLVLLPFMRAGLVEGVTPRLSILLAAMPAGATTTMLASKYERAPDFATRMVIFSTLCSIPTIFLWSMILA